MEKINRACKTLNIVKTIEDAIYLLVETIAVCATLLAPIAYFVIGIIAGYKGNKQLWSAETTAKTLLPAVAIFWVLIILIDIGVWHCRGGLRPISMLLEDYFEDKYGEKWRVSAPAVNKVDEIVELLKDQGYLDGVYTSAPRYVCPVAPDPRRKENDPAAMDYVRIDLTPSCAFGAPDLSYIAIYPTKVYCGRPFELGGNVEIFKRSSFGGHFNAKHDARFNYADGKLEVVDEDKDDLWYISEIEREKALTC